MMYNSATTIMTPTKFNVMQSEIFVLYSRLLVTINALKDLNQFSKGIHDTYPSIVSTTIDKGHLRTLINTRISVWQTYRANLPNANSC